MATLDLSEYIRVKNNSDEDLYGRYDGKDYLFEVGKVTDIHNLAATHIFGFGEEDKTTAFHRLGWFANGMNYKQAMQRLSEFEFGEVPSPQEEHKSAPRKAKTAKTSSPTPLADAGADVGGEFSNSSPSDALDGTEAESL